MIHCCSCQSLYYWWWSNWTYCPCDSGELQTITRPIVQYCREVLKLDFHPLLSNSKERRISVYYKRMLNTPSCSRHWHARDMLDRWLNEQFRNTAIVDLRVFADLDWEIIKVTLELYIKSTLFEHIVPARLILLQIPLESNLWCLRSLNIYSIVLCNEWQ